MDTDLTNLLLNQRSQNFDIVLVGKARASVDLQASESIVISQTQLKNGHVTLQELLLVDHQVGPAAADGFHGRAGKIKAGGEDIIRAKASGFQISLLGASQVAVVGDDQLDVRVGGHNSGEYRYTGRGFGIGGIINFLIDHCNAGILKSIENPLSALAAARLRHQT